MNKHMIKELLDGKEDPVVLEIGCNDGEDTEEFLREFKDIRLYCFECDPRALEQFRSRIGGGPRATLVSMAVGARCGEAEFHLSGGRAPGLERYGDWNKSSSLHRPRRHLEQLPWCGFDTTIKVPVTTLDQWSFDRRISCVDFIWADVQGAEADLIMGGRNTLSRTRYLYTEYSDEELYEGQICLSEILLALPNFTVRATVENNVLLENLRQERWLL